MAAIETASREAQLMLLCARARLSKAGQARLSELAGEGVDWERLWRLARWHGLLPLAAHHLLRAAEAGSIEVPHDLRKRLREQARAVAWRNTLLARELHNVVRLLQESEIPALPFKGPALAVTAYRDLTLRTCTDLDLLVRKRDVLRARKLLVQSWYRDLHPLTDTQDRLHLGTGYHFHLVKLERELPVELHWQVSDPYLPFQVDIDALWSRRREVELEGAPVPTLGLEDTLLVLCLHGAKHLWENLKLVADVAELVTQHPETDWELLLRLAKLARGVRAVRLGLLLARDLLEAPIPAEVLRGPDAALRALANELGERLVTRTGPPGGAEIYAGQLRLLDDWRSRARYCTRVLAPNIEDWGQTPLPGFLLPLYALSRPVRLLRKYFSGERAARPRRTLSDP